MRKSFVLVPFFFCALAGCATAQTGERLKATFDSGVAAYDAGDFANAYRIWSSITDEDIAAMRNVAMMRRNGTGTEKDPAGAVEMYQRAADAGLPTAQADLADMLLKGEAGPPNVARALPLLEAAAAANHPIAQYELAQLYETGNQVPQDMLAACNLYAAASHGMKQAADRLAALGPTPGPAPANKTP